MQMIFLYIGLYILLEIYILLLDISPQATVYLW